MAMVEPMANTWLLYNNARVSNHAPSLTDDPFHISAYIDESDLRSPEGVSAKVEAVLQPFRDLFRSSPQGPANITAAINTIFQEADKYSMRDYMYQNGMSTGDINWCETLDKSTGWYDRSFTESKQSSTFHEFPL